MAFISIGGGYKIIKNTDLRGQDGMQFEGYYLETDTGGKYPNPKVVFIATKPAKFNTATGEVFHVIPGERYGIAGGTMLANKAAQATEKVLSLFTYEGSSTLEEGKFKGKEAYRWNLAQDLSDVFNGTVPTTSEMMGEEDVPF